MTKQCKIDGCPRPYYARGYCNTHHHYYWSHGLLKKPTLQERIEVQIERIPEMGCWIWTGNINSTGYAQISVNNRVIGAHQASYIVFKGPIPLGLFVCHRCDIRCCVNPAHLFLGTPKDNTQDALRKGKLANCRAPKGLDNPQTRLTIQQLAYLRQSAKRTSDLAAELGVSQSVIQRWKFGKYKDVGCEDYEREMTALRRAG